jgi:inward rectifier potassium channel
MTASWPIFMGGAAIVFLAFNAVFASLYAICDNLIANVRDNVSLDYLYFSIETLSTVGGSGQCIGRIAIGLRRYAYAEMRAH